MNRRRSFPSTTDRVERVTIADCMFQLDHELTYVCPTCHRPVFWNGEGKPTEIRCDGRKGHLVIWSTPDD